MDKDEMCGLTGFYALNSKHSRSELHVKAQAMNKSLHHRGPDSGDLWQDPDHPLVLAHRRLSIIDLSADGAQPMESHSGRYMLVYNGEFYNYRALRTELEGKGITFKGRSDTEVFLAAVECWGLNQALQKINGMFAFALWDRKDKELHFARDRMGKKPLYIGWAGQSLLFASELKAFHAHDDFKPAINKNALSHFFAKGYVSAPHSIFENVWMLPPGHRLSVRIDSLDAGAALHRDMKPYWDAVDVVETARTKTPPDTDKAALEQFEDVFTACITDRLVSDVPLGAFLSGGIDSSSVVALMQKHVSQPVKTFTIGFEEAGFDEAQHAKTIANHLGTDHHELYLNAQQSLDVIPTLPDMYDEPFADISAIPTYLVSHFARQHVTVALSGDGGDEMLGGYSRHIQGPKIWNKIKGIPAPVRGALGKTLSALSPAAWDRIAFKHPQFGSKLHKAASMFDCADEQDIYQRLTSRGPHASTDELPDLPRQLNFTEKMMLWDTLTYLPGDILTKVDRASMATSLEARAPLLDPRVFEYVWRLPDHYKIRGGKGKWLLRECLAQYVPRDMFERPKQGFNIPVAAWLRGPLKDWAESLLDETSLNAHGLLDTQQVRNIWTAHLSGRGNNAEYLWNVLMFQSWYKKWM